MTVSARPRRSPPGWAHALGRELAAADARSGAVRSRLLTSARAEQDVASRARPIARAMSAAPTAADGVAAAALDAVGAGLDVARAVVREHYGPRP